MPVAPGRRAAFGVISLRPSFDAMPAVSDSRPAAFAR